MSEFPSIFEVPASQGLTARFFGYRNVSALRGQMSYPDPRMIPDDAVASAKNIQTWREGHRRRMPGSQVVVMPSAAHIGPTGMCWFNDGSYNYITCLNNVGLMGWNGGSWSTLAVPTVSNTQNLLIQGSINDSGTQKAAIYISNILYRTINLAYVKHDGSGSFTTGTSAAIQPTALAWWQDTLWYGADETISYSPAGGPTLATPTFVAGSINVDRDIGDYITAFCPARGLDPFMLVFMKRRIYVLRIGWDGTGGYIAFGASYLKPITTEVGCIATRSVATIGPYVFFLAEDGVRAITRAEDDALSAVRVPMSQPIQDIFDDLTWSLAYLASAVTFNGKYYLSIPTSGTKIAVLVYDLNTKSWNVWHNDNLVAPAMMAKTYFSSKAQLFYQMYTNQTESTINANHLYYYDDDHEYIGSATAIATEEISKSITFGMPENDKTWDEIEVEYTNLHATNAATLTVSCRTNGGSWSQIGAISIAALTTARTRTKYSLSSLSRGRDIQVKLAETGQGEAHVLGYVITAWVDPIVGT